MKIAIVGFVICAVIAGVVWVNIVVRRAPPLTKDEEEEEKRWWQALGF